LAAFFSHLECSTPCGRGPSDPRHIHQRCACGAPLLARYDLTAARRIPRSVLADRDATMWRYREVLPLLQSATKGLDLPVTLGEGWTPLVRARRLGAAVGLKRVYLKDEGRNPTGSWKARGSSAALTRALHLGVKHVALAAHPRAADATAAYAARAGVTAHIWMAASTRSAARPDPAVYGADIRASDEPLDALSEAAAVKASASEWYDVTPGAEPYRLEGQKTIGYELAEQLGWEVPDWVVCPSASGTTLAALGKAFLEMAALGWIDPVRRPHLVAVQAAGCAPLVRAFASGASRAEPWSEVQTRTIELAVARAALADLALKAIKDTGGTAIAAGDLEMARESAVLATVEGILASAGAGAALHALRVLVSEGRIKPHDTVVLLNPGTSADS
jgi:threonine synthase